MTCSQLANAKVGDILQSNSGHRYRIAARTATTLTIQTAEVDTFMPEETLSLPLAWQLFCAPAPQPSPIQPQLTPNHSWIPGAIFALAMLIGWWFY